MQLFNKVFNISAERDLKAASDLFIYKSDYEGALVVLERVLDQSPQSPKALVLYADVLFCLGRETEALNILDEVLAVDAGMVEAYISRAGVLEAFGKYRESLQCCRDALAQLTPAKAYLYPSILDQQIALLIRLKNYRAARAVLESAPGYMPNEEVEYLQLNYAGLLEQERQRRKDRQTTIATQPKPGLRLVYCAT